MDYLEEWEAGERAAAPHLFSPQVSQTSGVWILEDIFHFFTNGVRARTSILIHYFQLIHRAYRTETDDVYES